MKCAAHHNSTPFPGIINQQNHVSHPSMSSCTILFIAVHQPAGITRFLGHNCCPEGNSNTLFMLPKAACDFLDRAARQLLAGLTRWDGHWTGVLLAATAPLAAHVLAQAARRALTAAQASRAAFSAAGVGGGGSGLLRHHPRQDPSRMHNVTA